MQRGSLVVCQTDFMEERAAYPQHPYPHRKDILTVSGVNRHYPSGKLLLTFEELRLKLSIPLSEDCFLEIQTPEEGDTILEKFRNILLK